MASTRSSETLAAKTADLPSASKPALQPASRPALQSGSRSTSRRGAQPVAPASSATLPDDAPAARTRARPGERRVLILQALAAMLEQPKNEKITTAALAGRLGVSEAALYRHFASKAEMYEGLIEFIEQTIFTLINQITAQETSGVLQVRGIALMLLNFAEKNPGMTRVLTGEALVGEHERLLERMNQLTDRIETSLKQALKLAVTARRGSTDTHLPADYDPALRANLVVSYVLGRWQRYARSGFSRKPGEQADAQLRLMLQ
jgi:TetR/AcrR family transcriptional regulator